MSSYSGNMSNYTTQTDLTNSVILDNFFAVKNVNQNIINNVTDGGRYYHSTLSDDSTNDSFSRTNTPSNFKIGDKDLSTIFCKKYFLNSNDSAMSINTNIYSRIDFIIIGGGGGGGGGLARNYNFRGGGMGGGGEVTIGHFNVNKSGGNGYVTLSWTVGVAGNGGAAVATDHGGEADGNSGGNGSTSTINYIYVTYKASGGGGGGGGVRYNSLTGGNGGGGGGNNFGLDVGTTPNTLSLCDKNYVGRTATDAERNACAGDGFNRTDDTRLSTVYADHRSTIYAPCLDSYGAGGLNGGSSQIGGTSYGQEGTNGTGGVVIFYLTKRP